MKYTCPCCGYLTLNDLPGSHAICEICFWEDDMFQLKFPNLKSGPNKVSLIAAQENYKKYGVSEQSLKKYTRLATDDDIHDSQWRPLDLSKDIISQNDDFLGVAKDYDWENDLMSLYYWRKKNTSKF
jgi:hypothetical protein